MEPSQANPYQAPEANLTTPDAAIEPNTSSVFSLSGRIGRLRYLAYLMAIYLIVFGIMMVEGIIAAVAMPGMGETGTIILGLIAIFTAYLPLIFFCFVYAVRRLNDIGWSGWLSILLLVPFVNLILALALFFVPGEKTANRYGAPPRENSTAVIIGAVSSILVPIGIGILAAVAIPAYQDYVSRAQAAASQQPSSAPQGYYE